MNKKTDARTYLAVLLVFAGSNCLGAIDGALSMIAAQMNVSQTTALYVGSVATLACMVAGAFFGAVAGKFLPYKRAVLLCYGMAVVFGLCPFAVRNFAVLLLLRFLFGFGTGGIMCVQNPVATKLIPEDRRAGILGIGTCVSFGMQSAMQFVGGVLADVQWNFVFFTHFLLLVPMMLVLFLLPAIELEPRVQERKARSALPLPAVLMCVVQGIVWLNIAPLLFGSSFYAAALSDSATVAAVIAMMFSIGCMAGGLLYPVLYRRLKSHSFSVFLLVAAAGLVTSARAGSIPLLAAGFFLGGVGQSCMQAGIMMYLGLVCDGAKLGVASALMTICMNLGAFLCSSWDSLIGALTGDTLYIPLYIGAAMFALLAVVLFVKPPSTARS